MLPYDGAKSEADRRKRIVDRSPCFSRNGTADPAFVPFFVLRRLTNTGIPDK